MYGNDILDDLMTDKSKNTKNDKTDNTKNDTSDNKNENIPKSYVFINIFMSW